MKHINTFGTWVRINEAEEMAAPEPGAADAASDAASAELRSAELREMPKKIEAALSDIDALTDSAIAYVESKGLKTNRGPIKQIVQACTAEMKKTISTSEWYEAVRANGEGVDAIVKKIEAALITAMTSLIARNKQTYASVIRGLPTFTDENIKDQIAPVAVKAVGEALRAASVKFANASVLKNLNWFYRKFGWSLEKNRETLTPKVVQILTSVQPSGVGKALGTITSIFH